MSLSRLKSFEFLQTSAPFLREKREIQTQTCVLPQSDFQSHCVQIRTPLDLSFFSQKGESWFQKKGICHDSRIFKKVQRFFKLSDRLEKTFFSLRSF